MLISQLSKEQTKTVEKFLDHLSHAEWELDDLQKDWRQELKRGKDVYPEVTPRLETDQALLGLTCWPEKKYISVMIAAKDELLKYVEFRFYYSDRKQLLAALQLITTRQKQLSIGNYRDLIEDLLAVCPDIYWEIQTTKDEKVTKENLKEGHPRMTMTFK